MSTDHRWSLRHPKNHRSQISGWSLWLNSSCHLMFCVIRLTAIADKRGTIWRKRRDYNSQRIGCLLDNHTTTQQSHLLRIESLDCMFCDFCAPIELESVWCSETIDIVEWCKWPIAWGLMYPSFLQHTTEHVSIEKHLKWRSGSRQKLLIEVSNPMWCHRFLLRIASGNRRWGRCDQLFPILMVVSLNCFESVTETQDGTPHDYTSFPQDLPPRFCFSSWWETVFLYQLQYLLASK